MKRTLSYCHRGGATPLTGATIPAHLAAIAARFPEREAVVCCHQRRRLSYRELQREIAAAKLAARAQVR